MTFDDLRDLYQEVIMDHNRNPRNFHEMEDADRHVDGHNPLCGDTLTLFLKFDDDEVADVAWQGIGCAISRSSASLMTEAIKGKTLDEAKTLYKEFLKLIMRDGEPDEEVLGKLRVFAGVGEFPARVKCATLAWRTLESALEGEGDTVTTE